MSIKPLALIIGMTGGVGGATARALAARGFAIRALRRDTAPRRENGIEWRRGDAMSGADVADAAEGAAVIVHAANPPGYSNWRGLAIPMLANTIAAARRVGATVVFPGTIYNYGPDAFPVVGEDSAQRPLTRKGAIRVEMERMLRDAAGGGVRALVVRAGDFFGPGAGSSWFSQGLVRPGGALRRVIYPGSPDVGHSWAYLPDLGEAIARLTVRRAEFDPFETFHFEGHWLPHGARMAEVVCEVAGLDLARIVGFPWWATNALSPVVPLFREMREMRYLWQHAVRLDNRKLLRVLGDEPRTDLGAAVRDTLVSLGCLPAARAGARGSAEGDQEPAANVG